MGSPRLHITGASCSGVTTLGRALADKLGVQQVDVDGFYWMPTDPPFTTKRPPEERVRLIRQELPEKGWLLTGSLMGWGDALIKNVSMIVFVDTPTSIRMTRLKNRETERYGDRIKSGGDMFEIHTAFHQWALQYDDPTFSGRNRAKHETWLTVQEAPILCLDGTSTVSHLVSLVIQALSEVAPPEGCS